MSSAVQDGGLCGKRRFAIGGGFVLRLACKPEDVKAFAGLLKLQLPALRPVFQSGGIQLAQIYDLRMIRMVTDHKGFRSSHRPTRGR